MGSYESNIWKMHFIKLMNSMYFLASVTVPFFIEWGKIEYMQIMYLQMIYVFSVFLLEVPTGAVADYLGRKTSVALGILGITSGAILYASVPNFYVFAIAEFIWALGTSLISGADESIVYDSLKKLKKEKDSKKVLGRFNAFSKVGLILGAPIGSLIAHFIGLRYTFLLMAVPFMIALIFTLTLKEPKIERPKEDDNYFKVMFSGLKHFKKNKVLQILAFDSISIYTFAFMLIWVYQPKLEELGLGLVFFGVVHSAFAGIQIVFMNYFGKLEKAFGSKKKYILSSAIIGGLGFILLGLTKNLFVGVFAILVIAGFGLSRSILLDNYMHKHTPSKIRATVISTKSMLQRLANGIFYPILGLLFTWSMNYAIIILGILMISVSLVSRVREEHMID